MGMLADSKKAFEFFSKNKDIKGDVFAEIKEENKMFNLIFKLGNNQEKIINKVNKEYIEDFIEDLKFEKSEKLDNYILKERNRIF